MAADLDLHCLLWSVCLNTKVKYGSFIKYKCDLSKYKENTTKTYLYNFDPLKPHFYIIKLGFTGVYVIFLISAQNIDCGYSLELPR